MPEVAAVLGLSVQEAHAQRVVAIARRELGRQQVVDLGQLVLRERDFERADVLAEDDWRRANPRFERDNFAKNLELVERVKTLAAGKDATPAQLALAWVLTRISDGAPIPGTRSRTRLEENAGALEVGLSEDDLAEVDDLLPPELAAGDRYDALGMRFLYG